MHDIHGRVSRRLVSWQGKGMAALFCSILRRSSHRFWSGRGLPAAQDAWCDIWISQIVCGVVVILSSDGFLISPLPSHISRSSRRLLAQALSGGAKQAADEEDDGPASVSSHGRSGRSERGFQATFFLRSGLGGGRSRRLRAERRVLGVYGDRDGERRSCEGRRACDSLSCPLSRFCFLVTQIRCPDFPFGEGGDYQVCKNELRPGLQWSMESGWSVKKNTLMPELPPLVNLESPAFATRREERHKLSPKVASMITDSGPDESSTSSAPCAAENENAAADQGFLDEQTTSDEEELEDMSTLGEMVEKVRFMRDVLEYGMRGCLALRSQVDWEIVANQ
ncbi:uncharacterized protein LOC112343510 isoform X1 [Selaginella moellendorffii]|uniref:uncharacterized protein LOC112343510 isoform X1 n=1 Tax=Selaginella moellendorffii TaxID=88036 RepID=UPI000D1CD446|nr:uncharacterized protein LOC112343510 isoform X1 [Selaginella moellendorffii]|eukprot:XP_024522884.1 uncharacterized protein LOC112343510 isoform X1 [Selaginella moellendorffii]